MRKRIYSAIAEALRSAGAAKSVGLWNQTLQEQLPASEFPAVGVEFMPVQWQQQANRVKRAAWRLNVHILMPQPTASTEGEASEAFDAFEAVAAVLQGLSGEGFGPLQHVETLPDHLRGGVMHDVEGFVCPVTDTSAVRPRTPVRPAYVLKRTPAGR